MTEIIAVRFKNGGKEYYFDPRGEQVTQGTEVIIETAKGLEFGICSKGNTQVPDEAVVQPLRPMLRLANDKDRAALKANQDKEERAMKVCQEKIVTHKLDMKLVRCECSFDGNKLLFFFTSEGRVDFRALVKDLASTFHSRIELRQIGVRDESKMLGGLGICGRPFCCSAFLDQFQPVSIKMAKTQGLSLNPTKISGACGRLMCCLKYEQDAYEDAVKRMPKNESFVETPDGPGNVTSVNYLRETVKVRLEDSTEAPQTYSGTEINVIRNGKGRRPEGYVAPPAEELEKLRKTPAVPVIPDAKPLGSSIDSALSLFDGETELEPREEKSGNRRRRDRSNKPRRDGSSGGGGGKPRDPEQSHGGKPRDPDQGGRPRGQEQKPRNKGEQQPGKPKGGSRPPRPPRGKEGGNNPKPQENKAQGGSPKPQGEGGAPKRRRRPPRRPKGQGGGPAAPPAPKA